MLGKQNRTGQFSLYQTRLDTPVNPKVHTAPPRSDPFGKGHPPPKESFGPSGRSSMDLWGGEESPRESRGSLDKKG